MAARLQVAKAIAILAVLATLSSQALALRVLYGGQGLNAGEELTSGSYRFIMQNDCNLVLYNGDKATWSSGTYGQGTNCRAVMQRDANLVVYSGDNHPLWASGISISDDNYRLVMQGDGNVVIYTPDGHPLWATNTGSRKRLL